MNSRYKLALAMIVSAALGGAAIEGLHAQAKPPVYYIGENDVSNAEGYAKEYLPLVAASIKTYGGRYVAAGKPVGIHGEPPQERVIILVWENMEQLMRWFDSAENKNARKVGEQHAKFRNFAVPGVAQ